jgi:Alpha/beta hydrolase family
MGVIFVLVPGASQSPAAYGYLLHLLQLKGYGAFTSLLPSVGATGPVTATDDADYVRDRLLLPILDVEGHDIILISHSYSGIPASAAALGLGKAERLAAGKTTSVLGQIFIAAVVTPGGDGRDLVAAFGGHLPPHIRADVPTPLSSPLILPTKKYQRLTKDRTTQTCSNATTRAHRSSATCQQPSQTHRPFRP